MAIPNPGQNTAPLYTNMRVFRHVLKVMFSFLLIGGGWVKIKPEYVDSLSDEVISLLLLSAFYLSENVLCGNPSFDLDNNDQKMIVMLYESLENLFAIPQLNFIILASHSRHPFDKSISCCCDCIQLNTDDVKMW